MSKEFLRKKIRESKSKEQFLKELIISLEKSIESFANFIYQKGSNFTENIDSISSDFTSGKFTKFDSKMFSWAKNLCEFSNQNIYSQATLNYLNVFFDFFNKIHFSDRSSYGAYDFQKCKNHFFESCGLKAKIEDASFYFLNFSYEKFEISFSEEKNLIEFIDMKTLDDCFSLFRQSKNLTEKEMHMKEISVKVRPYFSDKHCPQHVQKLDREITEEKRRKVKKIINGYFLHDEKEKDSSDAKEWSTFSETKKKEILDKTFIDILYCLAILRQENLL